MDAGDWKEGNTMNAMDTIIKRKSIRHFTTEQIKEEELKQLIHAANAAPISGGGLADSDSAWHFTVIQNPALLDILSAAVATIIPVSQPFYGAPTLLIVSAAHNKYQAEQLDAALALQNVSIAATSLGLNSVTMNGVIYALNAEAALRHDLKIPDKFSPFIALAIGYTDDPSVKERHFHDDNVSYL